MKYKILKNKIIRINLQVNNLKITGLACKRKLENVFTSKETF